MKGLRWNEAAGGAAGLSAQALTCAESGLLLPLGLEENSHLPLFRAGTPCGRAVPDRAGQVSVFGTIDVVV